MQARITGAVLILLTLTQLAYSWPYRPEWFLWFPFGNQGGGGGGPSSPPPPSCTNALDFSNACNSQYLAYPGLV